MNIAAAIFGFLSIALLPIALAGYLFSLAVKWPVARRRWKWTVLGAAGAFVISVVAGASSQKENVAHRPSEKVADTAAQDAVRAPPPAKPGYCADKRATIRLPECGWTERQVREEEAAAAAQASDTGTAARTPPRSSCAVSAAQFAALQTGMSYGQSISTLGCAGEEVSRSEFSKYLSIMYTWRGDAFISSMNATFQNGGLVSKAQFGLR